MGNDYKRQARKEYLRYFRIWFIIIGVLAVLASVSAGVRYAINNAPRENADAPTERVYDYADVLTEDEEEKLRNQIAEAEKRLRMDIVIMTINESVEGEEAAEKFGSPYWEDNMQDLADDFWDENGFGYNVGFEGDGVLLLHNWYEGQNGEHLSTSGKAEWNLSSRDIDWLLDHVDWYYDSDPYRAYSEFVDAVVERLEEDVNADYSSYWLGSAIISTIVAAIYALVNLSHAKAKNTTPVNAYVADGKPVMSLKKDDFIRKHVTQHRIERSSSGGGGHSSGGGHSGGGGGHHTSHSGASHGGGSHRH